MKQIDVETLPLPRAEVGEGIIWCDRAQALWWVDIGRSLLHRLMMDGNRHDSWPMPSKIGCVALTEGSDVVVALTDGMFRFDPSVARLRHLADLLGDPPGNRPNDGAVSRGGRFFVATIPLADRFVARGHLYRFDGAMVEHCLSGLHVGNGLAFSPDDRTAYVSDSFPDVRLIWSFDHDPTDGTLRNRRVFFDTHQTAGRPDGACIDTEGCYWMAGVGGGEVLRLTPAGKIDLRIPMPSSRPSKLCFGGPDLRELYVTSIGAGSETAASDCADGALFVMTPGFQGLNEGRLSVRG